MSYQILCWIPVEPDDPEVYETKEEALKDLQNLKLMQPENIYKVVRVPKKKSPSV